MSARHPSRNHPGGSNVIGPDFQASFARAGLSAHQLAISRETRDLFLTREAAEAELCEIREDEPDWKNVLRVVPIELDKRAFSNN
jgi:hypothetical protein